MECMVVNVVIVMLQKKGRISFGMDAVSLSVSEYQDLIDRGWRRSGTWVYKPTNHKACCPQYTIRLDITKFQISKSQKQAIKRLNNYLEKGKIKKDKPIEEKKKIKLK